MIQSLLRTVPEGIYMSNIIIIVTMLSLLARESCLYYCCIQTSRVVNVYRFFFEFHVVNLWHVHLYTVELGSY